MREVMDLIEMQVNESSEQEQLRDFFDAVVFVATKYKSVALGAALFYELSPEKKIEYFNNYLITIWEHHSRVSSNGTDDILRRWRNADDPITHALR